MRLILATGRAPRLEGAGDFSRLSVLLEPTDAPRAEALRTTMAALGHTESEAQV